MVNMFQDNLNVLLWFTLPSNYHGESILSRIPLSSQSYLQISIGQEINHRKACHASGYVMLFSRGMHDCEAEWTEMTFEQSTLVGKDIEVQ